MGKSTKKTKIDANIERIIGIAADNSDVLDAVEHSKGIGESTLLEAMQFALSRPRTTYYDPSEDLEHDVEYKQCLITLRDLACERGVLLFYSDEPKTLALAAYVDAEINRHAEYHAWLDGN
jgi:hypothetical protein